MLPYEINKRIAELVYPYRTLSLVPNEDGIYVGSTSVDYCNNWNDLMPLVVECGIQHYWNKQKAKHFAYETPLDIAVSNSDLQLALAECLLKVLEAKAKEGL